MFRVLDMRTDSMKTTLDIDCTISGGGGFLSSWSLRTFSISFLSPETYALPFRLICAIEGL